MDFGKCPNQKMHESESAGFLVWALPVVWNHFWKQIFNKVLYNYRSKFFFGAFRSVFKKSQKMNFPLYFEKVIWVGWDIFFCRNVLLKKPNTSEYAQVLVVTWVKLDSVNALLSSHLGPCVFKTTYHQPNHKQMAIFWVYVCCQSDISSYKKTS